MHTPAEGFEVAGEEEKWTQCKERDLLCAVQVEHAGVGGVREHSLSQQA